MTLVARDILRDEARARGEKYAETVMAMKERVIRSLLAQCPDWDPDDEEGFIRRHSISLVGKVGDFKIDQLWIDGQYRGRFEWAVGAKGELFESRWIPGVEPI